MPRRPDDVSPILNQVLISIQSIIMVPKPYFNEPGYAEEQGTPAGEARSQEYSENIRVATMRHAMRDMLRHPPAGFEEQVPRYSRDALEMTPRSRRDAPALSRAAAAASARAYHNKSGAPQQRHHRSAWTQVRAHFRTVRPLLLRNLARWLDEARSTRQ